MTRDSEKIAVFLNGEARPQCIRAHAGESWCTSQVVGSDGQVVFNGFGQRKTVTEHGDIELRTEFT